MYSFKSRVRYSETGEDGRLTLTGMINYMQDCSTFHSEDCGVGVEYLKKIERAWLLSSWQIEIGSRPRLGEELSVGTWHNESRGIYGFRSFVIRDGRGRDCVRANSVWFLYDLKTGRPTRVRPEDTAAYGEPGPKLDLGSAPRKLVLSGAYEEKEPVVIARRHLDTNHHVNNAQYVEFAMEALPGGRRERRVQADYRKAARLGDVIVPRVSSLGDGVWVTALCSRQGEPYAIVRLETEGAEGPGRPDICSSERKR